jgi:mono/diheme cytochrome c family protein
MRRAILPALLLLLAGCDQMRSQPRYDADGRAALFADGKANQPPPPGTVAQEDAAWIAAEATRPPMTLALLQRGRERYAIACEPCHDPAGYGQGVVPSRGYPHPESFHTARLRAMTSRHVVEVITHGYGVMYPHADRVAPADRWAIAAYVQALQLSQGAHADALPAADRARLEAMHVR